MKSSNQLVFILHVIMIILMLNCNNYGKNYKIETADSNGIDTSNTLQFCRNTIDSLVDVCERKQEDIMYIRRYNSELRTTIDSLQLIIENNENYTMPFFIQDPNRKNGKLYGFIKRNGQVVVQPIYRRVGGFKNGYAIGYSAKGMKACLIDESGKHIIPAKFNFIGDDYGDGIRLVYDGTYWHYYNNKGEKIFSRKFLAASSFINSKALVRNESNELLYIDYDGVEREKAEFSPSLPDSLKGLSQEKLVRILLPREENEKFGFIHDYIKKYLWLENPERYYLYTSGSHGEPFTESYHKLKYGIIEIGLAGSGWYEISLHIPGITIEAAKKFIDETFHDGERITIKKDGNNIVITEYED